MRKLSSCSRLKPAYSTSARLSWMAKLATAPSCLAPLCSLNTAASEAFHPPATCLALPPAACLLVMSSGLLCCSGQSICWALLESMEDSAA